VRVLVIEDEETLAEAVAKGLQAEGFSVDVVHDGLEGLAKAREPVYGAVILDILLPGMNGYKVCQTLRDEGVWTPILMLTAKTGEYDEAEALDCGADDFLSKPFSFVVLVARLHALARRGSAAQRPELTCGDLALDPRHHLCRRGDVAVHLTRREEALLEALLRQAGGCVPKWTLLREVWGEGMDHDLNVVELYIGYLRRKVDAPFGRNTLQTERGVGYRLVPDG
jgi:two-component system OmpR family response regulator